MVARHGQTGCEGCHKRVCRTAIPEVMHDGDPASAADRSSAKRSAIMNTTQIYSGKCLYFQGGSASTLVGSSAFGVRMELTTCRAEDWNQPMLQKCANPSCAVRFRSLREGKPFSGGNAPARRRSAIRWRTPQNPAAGAFLACDSCSTHFTRTTC